MRHDTIDKPTVDKLTIDNLALVGLRGTGKTTVGVELAARLGWQFVDADEELQRRAGRSIGEIFAEQGESGFRDLESAVVDDLVRRSKHVVALGGGAILRVESRAALARQSFVVWLQAPIDELVRRVASDPRSAAQRPSLTGLAPAAEMAALFASRQPLYEASADCQVETSGKSPAQIAAEIVTMVQRVASG